MLFTSFANRYAIYGYFISLVAVVALVVEFSLTSLPKERVFIGNGRVCYGYREPCCSLALSHASGQYPMFPSLHIGNLVKIQLHNNMANSSAQICQLQLRKETFLVELQQMFYNRHILNNLTLQ